MGAAAATEQLHAVRLERNVLITLTDGVTLAADLYLPDGPGPFPTLISFYPYRKDDIIGSFSVYAQRWFTQRGYAHLLVDVRGSGGSAGQWVESMHPVPEGADGAHVVEWAVTQDWCDGSVGVWGISYGGLMAFGVAAERPPGLKAIAPVYGFWDIQSDFVAPGGCPNMLGLQQRECIMLAQELAPPTHRDAEGRWREVWRARLERLEREGPYSLRWFDHPDYDDYWRERVIALERIEVPAFLIAGWRDLFPEAMSEAYRRIPGSKQLLFGPWLHVQPDLAAREPVDWLGELLRFWDRWLRGVDDGGEDEPPVWLFVQGDGGWRREAEWPPSRTVEQIMYPTSGGVLETHQQEGGGDIYQGTPLVGVHGGQWDAMATGMGYPLDQGPDDLLSLRYTTEPLDDGLELGGSPEAVLHVERLDGEAPFTLVAKLVDVEPDGRAELITGGWVRVHGAGEARVRSGRLLVRARTRPPASPQRQLRGLPPVLAGSDRPRDRARPRRLRAAPAGGSRGPRGTVGGAASPARARARRALPVDDQRQPRMALGARRGGRRSLGHRWRRRGDAAARGRHVLDQPACDGIGLGRPS